MKTPPARPALWTLACLLSIGASSAAAQEDGEPDLAQVLKLSRRALGLTERSVGLELEGTTELGGMPATFEFVLAADGRFRLEIQGRLAEVTGFDGSRLWRYENGAPTYDLELDEREALLAVTAAWTGAWLQAPEAFELSWEDTGQAGRSELGIAVGLRDGNLRGTLVLDEDRLLPRRFALAEELGGGRARFDDWRNFGGRWLPQTIELVGLDGPRRQLAVLLAEAAEPAASIFEPPIRRGRDCRFDAKLPAELEVRRAATGHLFVKPLVNGQDLGWFLFDCRTSVSVLTAGAARRTATSPFGASVLAGYGPHPLPAKLLRTPTLKLGPLTIDELVCVHVEELEWADRLLGEPCAGVLGWDLLLRAVVEIDVQAPSIRLFDPKLHGLPTGTWFPLHMLKRTPHVRASFEGGHAGLFALDPGYGDLGVAFYSSAVERLGLLAGREVTALEIESRIGRLPLARGSLEYFDVAGRRAEPAAALFGIGPFDRAGSDALGLIGGAFLRSYRVVFDYSTRRVGFLLRG